MVRPSLFALKLTYTVRSGGEWEDTLCYPVTKWARSVRQVIPPGLTSITVQGDRGVPE